MLPCAARLRSRRDFDAVYRARRSVASPGMVLYVRVPSAVSGGARVGFVISKKTARRAHDRNRLKRRLREAARAVLLPHLSRSADVLFVARVPAVDSSLAVLCADMDALARQAGLMAAP